MHNKLDFDQILIIKNIGYKDTLFKIGPNGKTKIDKNTSNQKIKTTFYNQLFKMYNFVAQSKKDWFTLKVLKMHFVATKTKDKVHI